jgi:5-enolpyruvylshikimate-3-phosphate synthase
MQESLSKLLTDLKSAIHHSLSSDDVMAAMAALEEAGHRINVALDVTLNREENEESPDVAEGHEFDFTPTDALFLHSLRIAV